MLKRLFFLSLFVSLTLILISCAQDTSRNATVSFQLSSKTMEALAAGTNASKAMRASDSADGQELSGKVTLFVDGKGQEQNLNKEGNDYKTTFNNIRVGSKAKAKAEIYRGEKLIASGESNEITVKETGNELKITLSKINDGNGGGGDTDDIPAEGTIELIIHRFALKQNTTLSSPVIYQNSGEMIFSLLDEDKKDIFADIDWDIDSNKNAIETIYKVKYRSTDVTDLFDARRNTISTVYEHPISTTGTYQVYVTVTRGATTYINKEGQTIDLPEFEPVSGTFEYVVTPGIVVNVDEYFDLGEFAEYPSYPDTEDFQNVFGGYNTFNTLAIGIEDIVKNVSSSEVLLILRGTTDLNYTDFTSGVMTAAYNLSSKTFEVDMSAVTTENTSEDARVLGSYDGYGTSQNGDDQVLAANDNNPYNINTLFIPNDMIAFGKNVFNDSYINTIKCGEGLTRICYGAFCRSNIANIIFAENSNLQIIESSAFASTSISVLEIPASVVAIGPGAFYRMDGGGNDGLSFEDSSGTWYYTGSDTVDGKDQWEAWIDGTQTPPDHGDGIPAGEVTDILNTVKESDPNSKTYLFCVKD